MVDSKKGAVVRIKCSDEKGLIHKITGVLYEAGMNIVSNHEFVDNDTQRFFMRTEIKGDRIDNVPLEKSLLNCLPPQSYVKIHPLNPKNVVILVTKEHHCLSDLLIRNAHNELRCSISAVISNHSNLQELTEKFNLPFHFIDHTGLSRDTHEKQLLEQIANYSPDYLVLAKYMRILSAEFISGYENRIINIHHSFLPAFKGANPYRQAFERGVKIIGATAHFVTSDLDQGPIISQDIVSVDHGINIEEMTRTGREVEKIVLAKALRLVLEDRVFINKNKTIVFG